MNLSVPAAAREFADTARRAIASVGGTALVRRCERDPSSRDEVRQLLEDLGAFSLDPLGDHDEVVAAVELCRIAGQHVLPWPVAGALARIEDTYAAVIDPARPRIIHGDVASWRGVTLDRKVHGCLPSDVRVEGLLTPFVVAVEASGQPESLDDARMAASLWLQAATSIGALQTAVRLTIEHVTSREQFGRRLADFQAVRFKLADMSVAERGLQELLYFTAWNATRADARAPVADALALRVATIHHGKDILRSAHQLHGALGFCDEHDLSLVSRHLQPLLRLPLDLEASTEALDTELGSSGVDVLFAEA